MKISKERMESIDSCINPSTGLLDEAKNQWDSLPIYVANFLIHTDVELDPLLLYADVIKKLNFDDKEVMLINKIGEDGLKKQYDSLVEKFNEFLPIITNPPNVLMLRYFSDRAKNLFPEKDYLN